MAERSDQLGVEWITTDQPRRWKAVTGLTGAPVSALPDVLIQLDKPRQVMEGFGACFNELGWTSLGALNEADREGIFRELFAPGGGKLHALPHAAWRQ